MKASLSVAFSQRAPNRSNVREDGRVRDTVNQKIKNYEREKHERKQHRSESRSPERSHHSHTSQPLIASVEE